MSNASPDRSAAEARRRFVNLLRWAFATSIVVVAGTFAWFILTDTTITIHLLAATAIGIIAVLMLTAALMGLVYFSNRTGADERVGLDDEIGPRD